jgi:hypothetical protein
MKNILTIFILFTLFLSSCDPGLKVKYEVFNKTNNPINVEFQFVGDSSIRLVTIPGNESKILNVADNLGYIDDFNKRRDSIYLYHLTIRQGNKRTNVNFKNKKYWLLKKNGEHEGVYQLLFDSTLFNF